MSKVKKEMTTIIIITGQLEPPQNHSDSTRATYRKERQQGTIQNSHIVHCTDTAGSADVTVQNI